MLLIALLTACELLRLHPLAPCDSASVVDTGGDTGTTWYRDADGDTWGDEGDTLVLNIQPDDSYVARAGDCDDNDASVHPDAPELCDGVDNNCSGDETDAEDAFTWYRDADGDLYGVETDTTTACAVPDGYMGTAGDCDDTNPDVHPDQPEVCGDGVDSDCDGLDGVCTWTGSHQAAATAGARFDGGAAGDLVGAGLQGGVTGDLDGDGSPDLLVGAVGPSAAVGQAFVMYGPLESDYTPESATLTITGDSAAEEFAQSLSWAGDVNGDGRDDVLVGAPGFVFGQGAVYLFTEVLEESLAADSAARWLGSGDGEGTRVAAGGELTEDGLDDMLVSAPAWGRAAGLVTIIAGSTSFGSGQRVLNSVDAAGFSTFGGPDFNNGAGDTLAGLGDVNGDGQDDIAIGAPQGQGLTLDSGVVWIAYGPFTEGEHQGLGDADLTLAGDQAGAQVGASLARVGDVNNDGLADIVIASPGADHGGTDAGAVYLFHGGSWSGLVNASSDHDAKVFGVTPAGAVGSSVSGVGDLDDTGHHDLLVGASSLDSGGVVSLVYGAQWTGSLSMSEDLASFTSERANSELGAWVMAGGDLLDTGAPSLLMGAPANRTNGVASGTLYVLPGAPSD